MTREYFHDVEVAVEVDEGEVVVLLDIDGSLYDFNVKDAEVFHRMLTNAIEAAHDYLDGHPPCGGYDA